MLVTVSENRANRLDDSTVSWITIVSRLLLIAVFVIPFFTWIDRLGNPFEYFQLDLPPGQLLFSLSKLAALYAISMLWLQVMYGLLKGNVFAHHALPHWSVNAHRYLGIATLVMVMSHVFLFLAAVTLRTHSLPLHFLMPNFTDGYYAGAVSLGWCALVGLLVVATIGLLRSNMQGVWLWAHRLSLGVIVLALVHAQLVGSEAQTTIWVCLTVFFCLTMIIALLMRYASVKSPP